MGLYQLIYQSLSLVPFQEAELDALLARSRAYNRSRHITGILLHTADGRFFQALEGDEQAVRHLYYSRIVADPRHCDCRVVNEGPCLRRSFSDWTMGFRMARAQDLRTLLSHVPSDVPGLLIPRPHTRPELMALLLQFVVACETEPALEHPW